MTSATVDPATTPRRGRPRRTLLTISGALVLAWLLPVVAHLLRVDWLLLPVILLGTAALLRGGTTLLDRLVLAIAFSYGVTCVAGLLFSVWPWGLHPVPVAGSGLTALVIAYAATGRRPRLPWRARTADLAVLAGTAAVALVSLWPLAHRDLVGRLGMFIHTVDFSRHMMMFDVIRVSGGYMFLNRGTAAGLVHEPGFLTYPQGAHFVTALLHNFLVSGTGTGSARVWAASFIWLVVIQYIGLCLLVLWSFRRVAGAAASGLLALPLCAVATAYLALSDPITVLVRGYLQELPALGAVAVLVALLCRPLGRVREQVVFIGVLLAMISFTYYLFLPVAAVLAAGWVVVYRRRLLRVWRLTLVTAVLSMAAAAVIPLANRAASPGAVLLQGGQATPVSRGLVAAIAVLAFAGMAATAVRGSVVGRFGMFAILVPCVFALGVIWYERSHAGADYFAIKVLHETMFVVLVAAGAATQLIRPLLWRRAGGTGRAPVRYATVATVAVAALLVLGGGGFAATRVADGTHLGPGVLYARGRTTPETLAARNALAVYDAYPHPDGRTVVVLAGGPWPQYLSTVYYGVFTQRFSPAAAFAYGIQPWWRYYPPSAVEQRIAGTAATQPIRVVADDPRILADLHRLAATVPPGRLEIVDLRSLR